MTSLPRCRLGPGVSIRFCGGVSLLCSVPEELSGDTAQVLELATAAAGKICAADLQRLAMAAMGAMGWGWRWWMVVDLGEENIRKT